jgi:hypothetical protein
LRYWASNRGLFGVGRSRRHPWTDSAESTAASGSVSVLPVWALSRVRRGESAREPVHSVREPANYHPLCRLSGTPPRGCSVFERHNDGLRLRAAGPAGRTAGCVLDPARVDIQKVKCDGARGRSAFRNDGRDRAEGRATLCNDDVLVRTVSQLLLLAAAFVRMTDRFSNRWVRSGKASGGSSHRFAPSCTHPARFRTPVCTGAPAGADAQPGLCSLRPALRDTASIRARSHFTL